MFGWNATLGKRILQQVTNGPQVILFVPALGLSALWFGGQGALFLLAIAVPVLVLAEPARRPAIPRHIPDHLTNVALIETVDDTLQQARQQGLGTALLFVHLDGVFLDFETSQGRQQRRDIQNTVYGCLRAGDLAAWTQAGHLAVLPAPVPGITADTMLGLAKRLQRALQVPVGPGIAPPPARATIGLALSSRLRPGATGTELICAATRVLDDARAQGHASIRIASGRSDGKTFIRPQQQELATEAQRALENGSIRAWFQPQLCTNTGMLSGVEGFARWQHPDRGLIPPISFLAALDACGGSARLAQIMMEQSCKALTNWAERGIHVPSLTLNFSTEDLRDPELPSQLRETAQRHGVSPSRLRVDVLEKTIHSEFAADVLSTLTELQNLGCKIDLDDFGTGATTLAVLRSLPINRLKIDGSLVVRIDRDLHQRKMVAAILGLAGELDLDTLAEGVESHGEHALLAQLGCGHVQGFGIARPMPEGQLGDWLKRHNAKLAALPRVPRPRNPVV